MIVNAGLGVLGTSLFIDHMPETCEVGVMIRNPLQGNPINHYIPGYEKWQFQIIVRDRTHVGGETRSNAISKLLYFGNMNFTQADGSNLLINFCRPRTKPVTYPRLPNNLIEWSTMFEVNSAE
jgi:hypothetical protein